MSFLHQPESKNEKNRRSFLNQKNINRKLNKSFAFEETESNPPKTNNPILGKKNDNFDEIPLETKNLLVNLESYHNTVSSECFQINVLNRNERKYFSMDEFFECQSV
jgi:hypothetical protein